MPVTRSNKLLKSYDIIRTSFWFVPCLIIFATLGLCGLLLWVDAHCNLERVTWLRFLYHADGDITRGLLTTIAGSVMTVVSITFSITMVALTNASSQFGPRLIRNFMNDSSTQTVLGTFIAIFIYCLVLAGATDNFVVSGHLPGLTFGGAILLTLSGILLLIYFIHHTAINLQADNIIDKVYESLHSDIQNIFAGYKDKESSFCSHEDVLNEIDTDAPQIRSLHSGYVQAIDYQRLAQLMKHNDLCMEVLIMPGDFVTEQKLIIKHSGTKLSKEEINEVLSCLTLGAKRTPIQDPEFAILQLVEIALRALSPSINDPYSAIACIDKLSATLCNLTHKRFPEGITCDSNDTPRVVFKTVSFKGLANSAYDQIRQHSKHNLAVQLRLLEGLILIAEQAREFKHWSLVEQQKILLEHDLKQQSLIGNDHKEAHDRLNKLNELIDYAAIQQQ